MDIKAECAIGAFDMSSVLQKMHTVHFHTIDQDREIWRNLYQMPAAPVAIRNNLSKYYILLLRVVVYL